MHDISCRYQSLFEWERTAEDVLARLTQHNKSLVSSDVSLCVPADAFQLMFELVLGSLYSKKLVRVVARLCFLVFSLMPIFQLDHRGMIGV
jgi:hypothetical protein